MVKTGSPHRVLHIVSAMNRGGAETLLMNVHRNLDTSKIQFDYVSHVHEKCDFDDEIAALGGKVFRIPSLGQLGARGYLNELNKIMTHSNYAAVHSHTDYQSGFAALAAKRAGIRKRICHSHSNNWSRGNGFKANMTLKVLRAIIRYSATDFCACSTEAARFLYGNDRINTKKVKVLKNAIDLNQFFHDDEAVSSVRQELNLDPKTKIIGHVGRFSNSKNHRFLLKVLKKMVEDGEQVNAVLVGDGPLRPEIEEEAERLGIYGQIRFLGVRSDIPRLMRAFDVFLFPSLFEGFGIVTLEAQGSGTPCIAANTVPASTDLGLGLMTYISLDEKLEAWTTAINRAFQMEKPDLSRIRDAFSKSGFDIKKSVQDWVAIYGVS